MDLWIFAALMAVVAGAGAAVMSSRHRAHLAEAEASRLRRDLIAEQIVARQDRLTGLLNRRGFFEFGGALMADASRQPLVVVLFNVEPSIGGDEVLVALGRRFADYATSHVVARLDGGIFAALVTSTIAPDGVHYPHTQALAQLLTEPMWVAGQMVRASVTIGSSTVDESGLTTAVRRAEAAMLRSNRDQTFLSARKAGGRVTVGPLHYRSKIMARHHRRS